MLVDTAVQDKLDRSANDIEARLKDKKEGLQVKATHEYGENHIVVKFANAADTAEFDITEPRLQEYFDRMRTRPAYVRARAVN